MAWLRRTPNTYRVMQVEMTEGEIDDLGEQVSLSVNAHAGERMAGAVLRASGLEAVFVGRVDLAAWPIRTRREPLLRPVEAAISNQLLEYLGGHVSGDSPSSLLSRVRSAGVEYGIVPRSAAPAGGTPAPLSPRTSVLILSAVPMYDIGGGSRSAQLALEMLRRGVNVDYVSVFPSYESEDIGLRFIHPRLAEFRLDEYMSLYRSRLPDAGGWILVQVPSKEIMRVLSELARRGWSVCYDIIDRWSDRSLGGDWFDQRLERGRS